MLRGYQGSSSIDRNCLGVSFFMGEGMGALNSCAIGFWRSHPGLPSRGDLLLGKTRPGRGRYDRWRPLRLRLWRAIGGGGCLDADAQARAGPCDAEDISIANDWVVNEAIVEKTTIGTQATKRPSPTVKMQHRMLSRYNSTEQSDVVAAGATDANRGLGLVKRPALDGFLTDGMNQIYYNRGH